MSGLDKAATVRRAFELFAEQSFDELVQLLTLDVEWPDFRSGAMLKGRDAVRAYWEEQFALATPSVLLGQVFEIRDDVMAVGYEQLYDRTGRPVGEPAFGTFQFRFRGELVAGVKHSRLGPISDEVRAIFGQGELVPTDEP